MPIPEPGDEYAKLYDRISGSLYRYALVMLGSREQAEDVVQEVFVAVIRRGVKGMNSVEPYLRTSVRNACYSVLRQRRNGVPVHESFLEAVAGVSDAPDERLVVERALHDLPVEQREVVQLKVYQGLSFQEIAQATGESVNTVASRYRYGMEKLRGTFRERRTQ